MYEVSEYSCPHNFNSDPKHFDYAWGSYRYLTKEEMESIPDKDILNGIGANGNHTYNCSLRHLLNKKFGKIERSNVIKLETLGFIIRDVDYKEEREAYWKQSRKEKGILDE